MNDTATIRARIHDSAIRRVTRTFAATLRVEVPGRFGAWQAVLLSLPSRRRWHILRRSFETVAAAASRG